MTPSSTPTTTPSITPTLTPSSSPTFITNPPTNSPSNFPTNDPTNRPTLVPSRNPTKITIEPTIDPTTNPTRFCPGITEPDLEECSAARCCFCIDPDGTTSCRFITNSTCPDFNEAQGIVLNCTEPIETLPPTLATAIPTQSPSTPPTQAPTNTPTSITIDPTDSPSNIPTTNPTRLPTFNPTLNPSHTPSNTPSISPSLTPSINPTMTPTLTPTVVDCPGIAEPDTDECFQNGCCFCIDEDGNPLCGFEIDPDVCDTGTVIANCTAPFTNEPTLFTQPPTDQPTNTPTLSTNTPSNTPTNTPTLLTNTPSRTPTSSPISCPSFIEPSQEECFTAGCCFCINTAFGETSCVDESPPGSCDNGNILLNCTAPFTDAPTPSPTNISTNSPTNRPTLVPSRNPTLNTSAPTPAPSTSPTGNCGLVEPGGPADCNDKGCCFCLTAPMTPNFCDFLFPNGTCPGGCFISNNTRRLSSEELNTHKDCIECKHDKTIIDMELIPYEYYDYIQIYGLKFIVNKNTFKCGFHLNNWCYDTKQNDVLISSYLKFDECYNNINLDKDYELQKVLVYGNKNELKYNIYHNKYLVIFPQIANIDYDEVYINVNLQQNNDNNVDVNIQVPSFDDIHYQCLIYVLK